MSAAISSLIQPVDAALLRLDHVAKSFTAPGGGRFEAVRDVSLQVRRGDILGLVGKSGAGKSTLLRLINLLERPDAGSVHVAGIDLLALGPRELRAARRRIGMIFQQFNLLRNATAFDNVAFALRVQGGFGRSQIAERVHACLHRVGIGEKAASHPAQLSGGQKQRVAIARALATEPDLLLCDEPTSALDAETTRELLGTLRTVNAELGVTIVVVTHELGVVRSLCRHAAVIEHGRIAEQFAVADADAEGTRKTAFGRALARLAAEPDDAGAHDRLDQVNRHEPAFA